MYKFSRSELDKIILRSYYKIQVDYVSGEASRYLNVIDAMRYR